MRHENIKIVIKATRKVTCVVSYKNIEGHTVCVALSNFSIFFPCFLKNYFMLTAVGPERNKTVVTGNM
jgi:hypothetical protein